MKLKRTTIWAITGVSAAALAGLVVLQYFLLRNAYEFRQQAFERNVHAALNSVAHRLEAGEAADNFFQVALGSPHQGNKTMVVQVETDSLRGIKKKYTVTPMKDGAPFGERIPLSVRKNAIQYSVPVPQHVTLRVFNLARKSDTLLVDENKKPGEYTIQYLDPGVRNEEIVVKYRADSSTYTLHAVGGSNERVVKDASVRERREEIVGRAIDNLSLMELQPIESRVTPSQLDSVVRTTLQESGIDLPYASAVISARDDSLRMQAPAGYERELRSSSLRNPLFPDDLIPGRNQLVLFFPEQGNYLLKQVGPFLGLTVLFMGAVILCFGYTIRTIVRQKDFSLRLVEFINNMTHEFKTPISTIAVAAETITRPDVIDRTDKIRRYADVIRDENIRMKTQVDKILQMALLEEGDYELSLVPLDMHALIRDAAENTALQVEAKGGTVTCRLEAASFTVNADPVHMANIIHNILDNANKYSPEAPAITVLTRNTGDSLVIEIGDRGIGIGKEEREKVFEKYYRVRTGNVHDVKGFGLGLSYVRLMVEAQGGEVSISGDLGTGTTLHLAFPLLRGEPS
ncbi:MAG TPA: HAMP domain-containing sensor histidine kinase [Bacteroidota bacterium]|jgi:two-component system phosphate regulon sensor histidine kinase PhoR